jgi:hypothetical protein
VARQIPGHRPTYAIAGATFPGTRPSPADVGAQGAWLETQRERFDELHRQLLDEGWRPAGHGAHWWYKHGLEATVLPPEEVNGVDGYDAVVVGSAVHAGHWLKPARERQEDGACASQVRVSVPGLATYQVMGLGCRRRPTPS